MIEDRKGGGVVVDPGGGYDDGGRGGGGFGNIHLGGQNDKMQNLKA